MKSLMDAEGLPLPDCLQQPAAAKDLDGKLTSSYCIEKNALKSELQMWDLVNERMLKYLKAK